MEPGITKALRRAVHLGRRAKFITRTQGISALPTAVGGWLARQVKTAQAPTTDRWPGAHEPSTAVLEMQRAWSAARGATRFSLITPLHRTPRRLLEELVGSVQGQTYPHWELCLVVADDEADQLQSQVRRLAKADPRIKVARLPTNRGISQNSNAALKIATGDYVGLLDHDDVLAPFALYEVARLLEADPECDLVYSDEDKLSEDGKLRFAPELKPDYSPEMLLGYNYICHFAVLRRSLVEQLGGFRGEYDGAQDWDLFLRASQRTARIRHIPQCLYHWRAIASSCASGLEAKPGVTNTQRRVVEEHLSRDGLQAEVQLKANGTFRITWPLATQPLVSIVVPSRDKPQLIQRCIAGLLEHTDYENLELIIVDNGSTDPATLHLYRQWQERQSVTIVSFPQEFNYSAMCNAGARAARGEFLLFLNNDTEVLHPDWLTELVRWGQRPGIGVVGPMLLFPDGTLQHAGLILGLGALCGHVFHGAAQTQHTPWGGADRYRNVMALTGACQLISRPLFERLGGFNEDYHVGYSDLVFCLEAWKAGYRNLYTPYARLVHHECSTRPRIDPADDARRFAEYLHAAELWNDPYFNPQLSGEVQIPSLPHGTARTAREMLRHEIERHLAKGQEATTGDFLRKVYQCRHDVRQALPDALLPAGRERMLQWARNHGTCEYPGLHEGELNAYQEQIENTPGRNLAETYLLDPQLQRRFPLAMTVFGRAEFLRAMRISADLPAIYTPREELILLGRCRAQVAELLEHAQAGAAGQARLMSWLRTQARTEFQLSQQWLKGAEESLAAGAMARPGVNLIAPLSYQASLGVGSRGYLKALRSAGVDCACRNSPHCFEIDSVVNPDWLQGDLYDTSILVLQPEVLANEVARCGTEYRRSNYRIGVWYWELENFPQEWMSAFDHLDEVWVPSEFIAESLRKVTRLPIRRMSHVVEMEQAEVLTKSALGIPSDHFVFLFIFDIRSVLERKNPLGLIEAFRRAFKLSDKVTLLLKVGMHQHDPGGWQRLREAASGLPIRFLTAPLSRPRLYGLMQACDCYASLHRSEGFGMTLAEAMLLGKPVIATNYSGNIDFMTADTSLLVDQQPIEVPGGLPFYKPGNYWADPSLDQAAAHMRWVYEHREEARELGVRGQRHVHRMVSPEGVGETIRCRLGEIGNLQKSVAARAAA